MNFNRNEFTFRFWYDLLRTTDTAKSASLQKEFNILRTNPIKKALNCRPIFLPMQVTLNKVGQPQPYNVKTDPLPYNIIVTGYMSDSNNQVLLDKVSASEPLVYVGDANSLRLTLDEIAGMPQASNPKGQKGYFYLPNVELFGKGERISLDVYQRDNLDDGEPTVVNFVILGYRVLTQAEGDAQYQKQLNDINEFIGKRAAPKTLFLKTDVVFSDGDGGGENGTSTVYTPMLQEPVIIKGIRSTMQSCFVEIGVVGDVKFTELPTPVWAIAHGDEIPHENYLWNETGIFVPANTQIRIKCDNTGEAFDPQGLNGENTFTFIASSV